MEAQSAAQDVIRCLNCETPAPSKHCDICHIHLCEACVENHLSVKSKAHRVVPFKLRGCTVKCKCPGHASKICELHCERCNIPICTLCLSSGEHEQHNKEDILKMLATKKEQMQKDLQELEKFICPRYKEAAANISVQRNSMRHLVSEYKSRNTLLKNTLATFAPSNPAVHEARILKVTYTKRGRFKAFLSVSCLSDNEFWTCYFEDKIMRLFNLKGKLLKSVQTITGNSPEDIAVTRDGDLLYTDCNDRSINIIMDAQIRPIIQLHRGRPRSVCITSSGDLLAIIDSNDKKLSKVVRYSGSVEKQSIQFDDEDLPLYSSGSYTKHLCENRNFDICVADSGSSAVVVVTAAGKLRFRYTGAPSITKKPFDPVSIATDSRGNILTADWGNKIIHILDEDNLFLRYIDHRRLNCPYVLCVDSKDNLFVAECNTSRVKKIQY